ncbi:hypothetical protein NQZ68_028513 [Dissostichus eleginoides]|nr:hypothetical protein NQZ68_028513 [Dissostichus eleginoides]
MKLILKLQPGQDGPPTSIMGTTWTRSNFKKHTTNNLTASKQHQHQGIAVEQKTPLLSNPALSSAAGETERHSPSDVLKQINTQEQHRISGPDSPSIHMLAPGGGSKIIKQNSSRS